MTGLLGAGKTTYAVMRSVESARSSGAILASNIALSPPLGVTFVQLATGDDGIDLEALYDLRARARLEGRGLVLLLDEVGLLLPARFWATFPVPLLSFFTNSRKLRVDIWWVSQDELDVESSLRRRTQFVYKVRRIPPIAMHSARRQRRPWVLFVTRWSPGQVDKKQRRLGWEFVVWRPKWQGWFDTDELVEPAGRVLRRGRSAGESTTGSRRLRRDGAEAAWSATISAAGAALPDRREAAPAP